MQALLSPRLSLLTIFFVPVPFLDMGREWGGGAVCLPWAQSPAFPPAVLMIPVQWLLFPFCALSSPPAKTALRTALGQQGGLLGKGSHYQA